MDLVRVAILALLPCLSMAQAPDLYQPMSVRDFAIDGPKLAANHAKVQIIGIYILNGNIGMLYADQQAVIMAKYQPNAGRQPSVSLLTDGASHELRAALVSCDSNPATGQTGCSIEIQGRATMCDEVYQFATRSAPCVDVEGGGRWSPPPPSAEEVQHNQEVQAAEEARQAQETLQFKRDQYHQCVAKMFLSLPPIRRAVCGDPPQ